jgi:hypothetical protein
VNDLVVDSTDTNTYICSVANTANLPSVSPSFWTLYSKSGSTGPTGPALNLTVTENFMVAVGRAGNRLIYSYDGLTWIASASGTALIGGGQAECLCVAWNGSLWIAGGSVLIYSSDGINWNLGTSIVSKVSAVAWNGSLWLLGGNGANRLAYSTNGITWTASASASAIFADVRALAWNGYMWVAGGLLNTSNPQASVAYSYDGITWTTSASGTALFSESCNCVAWNGSLWVAGGGQNNRMAYSTDGITWTVSTSGNTRFTAFCNSIAWNGYLWVAGGNSGSILAYSTDGITWTAVTGTLPSSTGRCVAWNGSLWIAGGGAGGNQLLYSYNGINWTVSQGNSFFTLYTYAAAARRLLPNIGTTLTRSPVIQYGSGTTSGNTLTVTFPTAFAATPTITACVTNGSASWVSIGSASSTGFTAYTWNASGGVSVPFNWQAIV